MVAVGSSGYWMRGSYSHGGVWRDRQTGVSECVCVCICVCVCVCVCVCACLYSIYVCIVFVHVCHLAKREESSTKLLQSYEHGESLERKASHLHLCIVQSHSKMCLL